MISIPDPPKSMKAEPQSCASSIGILDRLPVELLHETLASLDFQSLTRFSRVSVQGKNVLLCLPAYRYLMRHAPHALAALGQTGLLRLHAATELMTALRSERCATCCEYGVYLFLPTCERCCWQCLRSYATRRVITPTAAARIFALSPKKVQQLPAMLSIPGRYGIARWAHPVPRRLVSLIAAKELALSIYGSERNIREIVARRKPSKKTTYAARDLQLAFVDSTTCPDSLMVPDQGNCGDDRYFGMATIPFPSLTTPDTADHGLWCKGCEWTYEQNKYRRVPAHVIANIAPVGCDPGHVLFELTRRARSRNGLLEHIRHCYGAQQLLAEGVLEIN